ERGEMRELLTHRDRARLAGLLQHDAQPRLPIEPTAGRVGAEHRDLAGGTDPLPLEDLDRRRLAGTVRPEQGEDLTAMDVEADVVDRVEGAVTLAQAPHPHGRFCGVHPFSLDPPGVRRESRS